MTLLHTRFGAWATARQQKFIEFPARIYVQGSPDVRRTQFMAGKYLSQDTYFIDYMYSRFDKIWWSYITLVYITLKTIAWDDVSTSNTYKSTKRETDFCFSFIEISCI